MASVDDRIEQLEKKLAQTKALKRKQEARTRAAARKKERADDTRRKILVGSAILQRVEQGEWPRDKLIAMLDKHLTRENDRELFDLEPLTPSATA